MDNPWLTDDELEKLRQRLSPEQWRLLYRGEFVSEPQTIKKTIEVEERRVLGRNRRIQKLPGHGVIKLSTGEEIVVDGSVKIEIIDEVDDEKTD